jgi:hypothetical protein
MHRVGRRETRASALLLVFFAGCGGASDAPETGGVSGHVTLDGKPLPGAMIVFQPEGGRPSNGRTDDEGYYELTYSRSQSGAMVGKHTVRITTYVEADDEGNGAVEEKVPAKYNAKSELTKDVAAGDQDIDFDLKSR